MTKELKKSIVRMYKLFDKEIENDVLDMFVSCLSGYELNQIKGAMAKAAMSCSFCPKPADILKHLKPSSDDQACQAADAVKRLQRAIESESMAFIEHDPILIHMAHSTAKLGQLAMMTSRDFGFYLERCKKEYINLLNSPEALIAIEQKNDQPLMIQDMMKKTSPKRIENE